MYCKLKNILCLSTLVAAIGLTNASFVKAQGMVSLEESTSEADIDPALNKGIPNELSLFDEESVIDEAQTQDLVSPAPSSFQDLPDIEDTLPPPPALAEPAPMAIPMPTVEQAPAVRFNNSGIGALAAENAEIDDNVFSQMSDLEKQTALLNLELRREKVKNDIEAIKNQRLLAIEQEKERKEEKARKQLELEKSLEQKVLQEQQKLRELDLSFERLRQERLLKSYKNKMLEDNQKWVDSSTDLYKQLIDLKKEKQEILDSSKQKIGALKVAAGNSRSVVLEARNAYERDIADLQTQISILKSRIEAQEKEMEKQNPFAEGEQEGAAQTATTAEQIVAVEAPVVEKVVKLSDLYAVMEIRGQGGELIAKLINQDGAPFYVKKGTSLQSGHIIDDITSTYVRADKSGLKDFLYFASGGILQQEPIKTEITMKDSLGAAAEEAAPEARTFISTDSIPGLGKDMMVR